MKLLWDNLRAFDEHTWTSSRSWMDPDHTETLRQSAFKDSYATNGKLLLDGMLDRAMDSLANYTQQPVGTRGCVQPAELDQEQPG